MGNGITVDATEFSAELKKQLTAFKNGIRDDMKKAIDESATTLKNKLRQKSPRRTRKDAYATHWKIKKEDMTRLFYGATVHNDKKYQLTHLLENGHLIVTHGRERGTGGQRIHIKPAAEDALKDFEEKCIEIVKERGGI